MPIIFRRVSEQPFHSSAFEKEEAVKLRLSLLKM
jgi:hypothetical protein